MTTIVLEHVKVAELPADWVKRIRAKPGEMVRVTLDKEISLPAQTLGKSKPNRSFGMWADREDVGDAGEYVARLRQTRYAMSK